MKNSENKETLYYEQLDGGDVLVNEETGTITKTVKKNRKRIRRRQQSNYRKAW